MLAALKNPRIIFFLHQMPRKIYSVRLLQTMPWQPVLDSQGNSQELLHTKAVSIICSVYVTANVRISPLGGSRALCTLSYFIGGVFTSLTPISQVVTDWQLSCMHPHNIGLVIHTCTCTTVRPAWSPPPGTAHMEFPATVLSRICICKCSLRRTKYLYCLFFILFFFFIYLLFLLPRLGVLSGTVWLGCIMKKSSECTLEKRNPTMFISVLNGRIGFSA